MKLKSFGCSFIFGSDLQDDGRNGPYATGSKLTFPALIAKAMGMEYLTYARPGASNLEILFWLLGEIASQEPALYMINWTYIDRFGYIREEHATKSRWNPMGWTSIMPIDDSEVADCYHRYIHSQTRDKFDSLNIIKSAVDSLRTHGHQFVMTWTDFLLWETEWHCPPVIDYLQKQTKPYCSDFDGMSFLQWSKRHLFAISDTDHPLESAHRAAADLILSHWQDYLKQ